MYPIELGLNIWESLFGWIFKVRASGWRASPLGIWFHVVNFPSELAYGITVEFFNILLIGNSFIILYDL
jgi:hypothetical protein